MTPDKNFRMKASTKVALASGRFKDAHERGAFKRMMIEAQLQEEAARRAALKSKDVTIGGKHSKEGVALD